MVVDKEAIVPNSLQTPSRASFVVKITKKEEIKEADNFADKEKLPLIAIGEGNNIIPQEHIRAVVAIIDIKGIIAGEKFTAMAGENWDDVVKVAIQNRLSGIETLSGIPGKAGSAPIQNIGAYGTEISDVLEDVEVYDKEIKKFVILYNKDCRFGYRDSLFKNNPNQFIISSLTLKLSEKEPEMPKYKDVENYFNEKKTAKPTLSEIREAILKIREKKLPDPKILPNAGSFFINPLVAPNKAENLKKFFPEIPLFPFFDKMKVPAGWLIEKAGLKGQKIGKMEISPLNALILTNPNKANFEEIMEAEKFIIQKVFQKFGISLQREPRIVG